MKKGRVFEIISILWVLIVIYIIYLFLCSTSSGAYLTLIYVIPMTVVIMAVPLIVLFVIWDFLSNAWSILTNRYYWRIQHAKNYGEAKGYQYIEPIDWDFSIISKDGERWYILYQQDDYPSIGDKSYFMIGETVYEGTSEKVLEKVKKIKRDLGR